MKGVYNYVQSASRMVVERTFGILKKRWRCLANELDADIDDVPNTVAPCCVLHNIVEKMENDSVDIDDGFEGIDDNEGQIGQNDVRQRDNLVEGYHVRDRLAQM